MIQTIGHLFAQYPAYSTFAAVCGGFFVLWLLCALFGGRKPAPKEVRKEPQPEKDSTEIIVSISREDCDKLREVFRS